MRTSIGALNVTTKGYDVVAELEAQGDKYGMAKYIRENKKECEEKARQYLAEHPKTTYYIASGYPTMMAHEDFTPEPNYSALIPFTEDEIERIKQLIVQVWNESDSDSPIQSIDDIDDFCLSDWEGANDELDHLIWERAEFYDFVLTDLDLNHPVHAYEFHTFAYSIENLQCYAPSLHNVCVAVTLNDHQLIDVEEFMKQYSIAIFPLFVWSIWHYRRPIYTEFTITDFNRIIELGGFNLNQPFAAIANLRHKVGSRIAILQKKNPDAKESYLELKRELIEDYGINPEETYLYIQGHHLFDKVVVQVLDKICSQLIRERENEIRRQARHQTQMRNELSCYSHSTQDIAQMLKKNLAYVMSEPFRRIQDSVERFLNST